MNTPDAVIAEWAGWRMEPLRCRWVHNDQRVSYGLTPPAYSNDLNLMHQAEMLLSVETPPATSEQPNPKSDRQHYREQLCVVCCMAGGPIHATAQQRASALLKVINSTSK